MICSDDDAVILDVNALVSHITAVIGSSFLIRVYSCKFAATSVFYMFLEGQMSNSTHASCFGFLAGQTFLP